MRALAGALAYLERVATQLAVFKAPPWANLGGAFCRACSRFTMRRPVQRAASDAEAPKPVPTIFPTQTRDDRDRTSRRERHRHFRSIFHARSEDQILTLTRQRSAAPKRIGRRKTVPVLIDLPPRRPFRARLRPWPKDRPSNRPTPGPSITSRERRPSWWGSCMRPTSRPRSRRQSRNTTCRQAQREGARRGSDLAGRTGGIRPGTSSLPIRPPNRPIAGHALPDMRRRKAQNMLLKW
jgi:hypothetical protein